MHGALAFAEGTADLAHTISVYNGGNQSRDCVEKVRYFKNKVRITTKNKNTQDSEQAPNKTLCIASRGVTGFKTNIFA